MANIGDKINNILKAVYGKDVRQSLADGLKAINSENENTSQRQSDVEQAQELLNTKFNEQIKNMTLDNPSNAEIVDLRVNVNGERFDTAGERVASMDESIGALKDEIKNIFKNHLNISVKDFGAVGDGKTDDTLAFQKAIDSIDDSVTATVFVPVGNYIIDQIVLKEGITLQGTGMNSKLFQSDAQVEAMITNRVREGKHEIDIHIQDLLLWGNKNTVGDGIRLKGSYFSSIENCKITNFSGNGASLYGGGQEYNTNHIKNCIIFDNEKYGVFADGSGADFHIQGGDIGNNKEGNIILFSPSSSITGVKAIWGSREGNGVTVAAANIQVVNNNIEGNAKIGIEVYEDNCFIEGNKLYADSKEGKYKYAAIEVREQANNTSILSNQILGNLYESSIGNGIKNSGTNTNIYSNTITVDPSKTGNDLIPVLTSKPINSDYSWVKSNVMVKTNSDIAIPPKTDQVLPLSNVVIDTEGNMVNNGFKAKHKGIYTFKFTAMVNSPKQGDQPSYIKVMDNKQRIYIYNLVEFGVVSFSVDIELEREEFLFFYIYTPSPATLLKDSFSFSVRRALM